jgi:hypothetical protein
MGTILRKLNLFVAWVILHERPELWMQPGVRKKLVPFSKFWLSCSEISRKELKMETIIRYSQDCGVGTQNLQLRLFNF